MENVIVLDFGGQYNQLIARRVREFNVYCELLPYTTPLDKILEKKPIGIIFTGGPASVFEENAPTVTATTATCPVAAMANPEKKLYGVQFHPEVMHTTFGSAVLKNFLYEICGAKGEWTMANFAETTIAKLKAKIGDKKVLCALSGGVDSAVAATLIHKACPNLVCIFVDHGLLRKYEADEVVRVFRDEQGMNLI